MYIPIGNLLKSGLTAGHTYWKKINILLKRHVPLNLLSLFLRADLLDY